MKAFHPTISRIVSRQRRLLCLSVATLLASAPVPYLRAQDAPTVQAQKQDSSRPLLHELDGEMRSLYSEVESGMAHVQMPTPRYLSEARDDDPIKKYPLDPKVRQQLEQNKDAQLNTSICPTTQAGAVMTLKSAPDPLSAEANKPRMQITWGVATKGNGEAAMQPRVVNGQGTVIEIHGNSTGSLQLQLKPASDFVPNNVGLVLDNQGHLLVPLYVEKEAVDPKGVRLQMGGAGQPVTAKFVGSDRQTNITILQLDNPAGNPVKLSDSRPADGSIVLILAPNNGAGRLAVWTGGQQDYGVVVDMDGAVEGFARYGQFLSTVSCKPVIEQLIQFGVVRRAKLGIVLQEVNSQDPLREQMPALASQPALRVNEVTPDSAADKAGLKAGDLILSLEDQPVGDTPTFAAAIAARSGKTTLKIMRENAVQTVTVDLKPE